MFIEFRKLILGSALVACLGATPAWAGHADDRDCWDVEGEISAAPPAECASPVGFCAVGTSTGDLAGTYDFVAYSITVLGDPATSNKQVYKSNTDITWAFDSGSKFITDEQGLLVAQPDYTADFYSLLTIKKGTGYFEGLKGYIYATGKMNLITGATSGKYKGKICEDEYSEAYNTYNANDDDSRRGSKKKKHRHH